MFAMVIPGVSAAEDIENGKVIGILGDADQSGKIDIKDATNVRKAVADAVTLSDVQQILANVDGGKLNVNDATWIQKYFAEYDSSALGIGKDVAVLDEQPTTAPTKPTTVEDTTEATPDQPSTDPTPIKQFNSVGLIGTVDGNDGWDSESYDLTNADGVWSVEIEFTGGENNFKARVNDDWKISFGIDGDGEDTNITENLEGKYIISIANGAALVITPVE